MSYDLYYFRPAEGASVEECVNFLVEDESDEDEQEDGVVGPFDAELDGGELTRIVAYPLLSASVPSESRTPELNEFLAGGPRVASSKDLEEIPEAAGLMDWWMDIGIVGVFMTGFSFGGGLASMEPVLCAMVRALAREGIHVYDPQADGIVPADNPEAHFGNGLKEAEEDFRNMLGNLGKMDI